MLPLRTVRIRPEVFQSKSGQNHEAEDARVSPETRRPLWVTLLLVGHFGPGRSLDHSPLARSSTPMTRLVSVLGNAGTATFTLRCSSATDVHCQHCEFIY